MLTYFCKRKSDARIVGIVNIRLALNDFLRTEFGHIGSARTILNCGAPLNAEFSADISAKPSSNT